MILSWITIRVSDFEKSKNFYGNYLGLKLKREFSPKPDMKIAFFATENNVEIELIFEQGSIASNTNVSIGICSLDYTKLLNEARSRNIIASGPAVLGGNLECFFVKDPNGVEIQIIKN